jgi:hypothetical protein
MKESDPPLPSAGGELLRRMVVLVRLSEHLGRIDPRRVLLDKLLRQLQLFSRMSQRLGIAAPETPLMRAVRHEIELGCLECAAWRRCREWLDGRSTDDDYGDFCPNEGLFAVMPRQDAVEPDAL